LQAAIRTSAQSLGLATEDLPSLAGQEAQEVAKIGFFRLPCENDPEGIVAKRKCDPYLLEHVQSPRIRNQEYSHWVGREELFEREGGSDPDFRLWAGCVLACGEAHPEWRFPIFCMWRHIGQQLPSTLQ